MKVFVEFKNENVFRNYHSVLHHPNLIELEWWWLNEFGETVVTSAFRYGDKGVHGQNPLRAVDLRSWIYSNPAGMARYANTVWIYSPQKPKKKCVLLHNVRDRGIHFHLQVCDQTIKL